jgi:hypothetical protein
VSQWEDPALLALHRSEQEVALAFVVPHPLPHVVQKSGRKIIMPLTALPVYPAAAAARSAGPRALTKALNGVIVYFCTKSLQDMLWTSNVAFLIRSQQSI